MKTLQEFKLTDDGIEVEYEIVTLVDEKLNTTSAARTEVDLAIDDIDKRLAYNQEKIDKLNCEIERLTNHADGIDYTIAVASGILTGLIDVFFVGEFSLKEGSLWGKQKVDSFVQKIAEKSGYNGNSLSGAVSFLEEKYPIPADYATAQFGGGLQHHLRDFSHHPTPIGLIFSLLTQFTGNSYGTDTFGKFLVVDVSNSGLIGNNLPNKIVIGVVNWFFHMVSDVAGSSGSVASGSLGTGLPGPFVSLVKELATLPIFKHTEQNHDVSLWVSRLFNGTLFADRDVNGRLIRESVVKFDLRTELGVLQQLGKQAVPVIINECIVRTSYFIRRLYREFKEKGIDSFSSFIHDIDWKKTLPFNNRTIVRMMTIASGTFVAVDLGDAAIRAVMKSGGSAPKFAAEMLLRVNFVGVGRFVIAIGSDVYMGFKKNRLQYQRMCRQSEQIILHTAKIKYMQSGMWITAKDTAIAIGQMETHTEDAVEFLMDSLNEMSRDMAQISSCKEGVERHNPDLLDNISNLIKYGK